MREDASLEQLIVIADFDATLTTGNSDQCHDLVGFSPLMAPAFRDEFAPLLDWQSNAAIDGVEWWHTAHSLMVKHGMPSRSILPRLVRESKMEPRPGLLKMLAKLAALQVPLLIVSAGLSDIIEEFLRQHDALTENVTVCSNRLNYGADSVPHGLAPDPPITSFTKSTAYHASKAFFKQHAERSTVLVLGDSTTDIDSVSARKGQIMDTAPSPSMPSPIPSHADSALSSSTLPVRQSSPRLSHTLTGAQRPVCPPAHRWLPQRQARRRGGRSRTGAPKCARFETHVPLASE